VFWASQYRRIRIIRSLGSSWKGTHNNTFFSILRGWGRLEKQVFLEGIHNKNNVKIGHLSLSCKKNLSAAILYDTIVWMWRVASNTDAKKLLAFEAFISQCTSLHTLQHKHFCAPWSVVLHRHALFFTVLYFFALIVWFCTVMRWSALEFTVLRRRALFYTDMYLSALSCTALHCHVLFLRFGMHCSALSSAV
jgi:hypothetical protein